MERATEDTYVAELVSVIKEIGGPIGYDAEFNKITQSGRADVNLLFNGKLVAVIEVKIPDIPLSDPALKVQAEGYAEWYRKNRGVCFYGIHNLKYLSIFKYVGKENRKDISLNEWIGQKKADWASITDFPFRIMPWVKSISEYKTISTHREARNNLTSFLLKFKELLEGKSLDLSFEVIDVVKRHIEDGASHGLTRMEDLYNTGENNVRVLFEDWLKGRGIQKPKDNAELRVLLTQMIKEQLYTLSMKVLFYFVLQHIDAEMSAKLKEKFNVMPSDAEYFQKNLETLFEYAMEKTGDFKEVFGSNTVDRLPIVDQTLSSLGDLISYLHQIRWSEINVDIIGRVFEGLIYTERRHLLGQHYTETTVVDLILSATLKQPAKVLDPSCGSGTFLVRALNYWKANYQVSQKNLEFTEGMDIDKLASMLSKVNLYIQGLSIIKDNKTFNPKIYHQDFFKIPLANSDVTYAITNPPYTRQEEMTMAFYDKDYKKNFDVTVEDIPDWDKRASIYAYFLVRGAKLLKPNGRLGFIVENSWLNTEYGHPLKKWFLKDYSIEFVIESIRERWFQDASIITNILVCEKTQNQNSVSNFIYLKKTLVELFGVPPPSNDTVANQNYYEKMQELFSKAKKTKSDKDYSIQETDDYRIVSIKKELLEKIEDNLGKWGIMKGSKEYFEIIIEYLNQRNVNLKPLDTIIDVERGITSNANEIFYLPSKYWTQVDETENYLTLRGSKFRALKLSKEYLRPLIRLPHIKKAPYVISKLTKKKHEDYVLWVEDTTKVHDIGVKEYIEWAKGFIKEQHEEDSTRFPTMVDKLDTPNWTQLPTKTNAKFFFKNDLNTNYAISLNRVSDAQVDKRLFLGIPKVDVDERILFAVLNSVFTYLGMELMGRTNLGEGALDVNVVDYNKIPIVDPEKLKNKLDSEKQLDSFLKVVDKVMSIPPNDIATEANNPNRLKMEEMVLGTLGLKKGAIKKFYQDLTTLSELQTKRATSLKANKTQKQKN